MERDMTITSTLVGDIIAAAANQGINQKQLAKAADVAPETLTRIKQKGTANLGVLERLARAGGVRIQVVGAPAVPEKKSFRERYKSLAWSNSKAPTSTLLQRALLRPQFDVLLDAAVEFGIDRLQREWQALSAGDSPEASRAAPRTEQILRNLAHGYQQATA